MSKGLHSTAPDSAASSCPHSGGPYFFFLIFFFCLLMPPAKGQDAGKKDLGFVSAGAGVLTFRGDVGSGSIVGAYSYLRPGFSFGVGKKLTRHVAIALDFLEGKIARDDKPSDNLPKLNFESPVRQFGLTVMLTGGGKKEHYIAPFLSAGIAYLIFDPHADLLDRNGVPYNYWKDGSVRNLPEGGSNYFYAKELARDYTYETRLGDSAGYARHALVVPVSAGIKFILTPCVDVKLGLTYHFAFSDYLDNVKSGRSDRYLFTSVSLDWNIFVASKEKGPDIDFATIDQMDTDHDGVLDVNDFCPGTPKEVKVDAKGCPVDSDADGIPDYADKEPHSRPGRPVDANGAELTGQRMAQMQKQQNAEAELHKNTLDNQQAGQKPGSEFLKALEALQQENAKNKGLKSLAADIPSDLRIADRNNDGKISNEELTLAIDAFFDGMPGFSGEQLNRLIDFYFDQ